MQVSLGKRWGQVKRHQCSILFRPDTRIHCWRGGVSTKKLRSSERIQICSNSTSLIFEFLWSIAREIACSPWRIISFSSMLAVALVCVQRERSTARARTYHNVSILLFSCSRTLAKAFAFSSPRRMLLVLIIGGIMWVRQFIHAEQIRLTWLLATCCFRAAMRETRDPRCRKWCTRKCCKKVSCLQEQKGAQLAQDGQSYCGGVSTRLQAQQGFAPSTLFL